MNIEKIIDIFCKGKDENAVNEFLTFLSDKLWNEYKKHLMDERVIIENKVKDLMIAIPNASAKKPYSATVVIPCTDLSDMNLSGITEEEHGLKIIKNEDGNSFSISGTPTVSGTFDLTLKYKYGGLTFDRPYLERKLQIIINPDPRDLWKDIPVPEGIEYPKADTACEYVKVEALADGTPQKDIVAASKRGRSHGQEGKPRDDDFKLKHMDNGWYIMAVADGAGSAKYSRQGSRIACEEAVNYCNVKLDGNKDFEKAIGRYNTLTNEGEKDARKAVGDYIYNIVAMAAFKAHKAINAEAASKNVSPKFYATTLLLTICKRFSFGWFIAAFWVGDGAICLYDRKAHSAKILGNPDEGEYAGQTRFLTMREIFADSAKLYGRLRFSIVDDFTALFLMSDGVSDPKFETDANLNNPDKWDALWEDLKENGVELTDDNEASAQQLLNWLDFWSPGNHDDRTIAILYEGDKTDIHEEIPVETEVELTENVSEDVVESNEKKELEAPKEGSEVESLEE